MSVSLEDGFVSHSLLCALGFHAKVPKKMSLDICQREPTTLFVLVWFLETGSLLKIIYF